jgi:hypothetical protein
MEISNFEGAITQRLVLEKETRIHTKNVLCHKRDGYLCGCHANRHQIHAKLVSNARQITRQITFRVSHTKRAHERCYRDGEFNCCCWNATPEENAIFMNERAPKEVGVVFLSICIREAAFFPSRRRYEADKMQPQIDLHVLITDCNECARGLSSLLHFHEYPMSGQNADKRAPRHSFAKLMEIASF